MVRYSEHDMADRKFLFKRGGVWNVRFRLPDRYGGGFFQRSLGTGDITTARRFRDLYVAPFLRDDEEYVAIKDLVEKAIRVRATEDKKYDRLLRALSGGEEPEAEVESLRTLVDKYLAHIARGDISPATLQAYTSHLEGFLRVVGEERAATSIEKQDLVVFRDKLLSLPVNWMRLQHIPPANQIKKKVSKATVSTALTYVRGFFQWLIDEGPFESRLNPVQGVKVPFTKVNNRRPFTTAEVEQACKIPYPTRHTKFDEEAWTSLPLLARYTGARLGEIAQLAGKDVVEVHGIPCLHIYERQSEGKTTKTHDDRLVPIANKIQPLLNALRKTHGEGPLFPHCGTWTDKKFGVVKPAKQFSNVYQRAVKKVAPDVTFHSFRHYAVSQMANAGIPEEVRMRIVGHKTKTVHGGYTAIDVETMAKAVEMIY